MCHTNHELSFSVLVHLYQKPKCLVQLKKNQRKSLTNQGETTNKFCSDYLMSQRAKTHTIR